MCIPLTSKERDVLFKIELPDCEEGESVPFARLRLSYFNVLDSKQFDLDVVATIDRPCQVGHLEVARFFVFSHSF